LRVSCAFLALAFLAVVLSLALLSLLGRLLQLIEHPAG
jgi:hypothetical protein